MILGPGICAVFFDAVGTLLHLRESIAVTYSAFAARHGVTVSPESLRPRLRQAVQKQEQIDFAAGWRTSEEREYERWSSIVHETIPELGDNRDCLHALLEHYASPDAWQLLPNTREVLAELHQRGLVLGMASNFDARLSRVVAAIPDLQLLQANCLVSSLITWRKPAAEFFAEVIRVAGCPAEKILFVGDDPRNDIEGATSAGMPAILLDPKAQPGTPGVISELTQLLN